MVIGKSSDIPVVVLVTLTVYCCFSEGVFLGSQKLYIQSDPRDKVMFAPSLSVADRVCPGVVFPTFIWLGFVVISISSKRPSGRSMAGREAICIAIVLD